MTKWEDSDDERDKAAQKKKQIRDLDGKMVNRYLRNSETKIQKMALSKSKFI